MSMIIQNLSVVLGCVLGFCAYYWMQDFRHWLGRKKRREARVRTAQAFCDFVRSTRP